MSICWQYCRLEKYILKYIHLKSENLTQSNLSQIHLLKNLFKWYFIPPKKQILKYPYKHILF